MWIFRKLLNTIYFKTKNYEVIGYDIGFFKGCNLYENPEFENNLILKDARNLNLQILKIVILLFIWQEYLMIL